MKKSFVERIFPHSPNSVLPQPDYDTTPSRVLSSPPRISLRDSSSSPSTRPSSSRKSLQNAPLSASIVHHDDPFLPIERASRSLQDTIQAYLDAQSEGLSASLGGAATDNLSSVGSPTPTPSVTTPSRSLHGVKTIPIRQPLPKQISLRGARRGLAKSMDEFVHLKNEELRVIQLETKIRKDAIRRTKLFEDKKSSLIQEIETIRQEGSDSGATSLRTEARKVEVEIQELESRLFEMRARHRHLIAQASQLESSIDSKLSSYKSSIALVEKDVKQFLKHPPVPYSLAEFDATGTTHGGMYALKPERRTLQMAQEHWLSEQKILTNRQADVENEQLALRQGADVWREATKRIHGFERELRAVLSQPPTGASSQVGHSNGISEIGSPPDPTPSLVAKLSDLIQSLEVDFAEAQSKNWNLLICCLGAELEALEQGRALLQGISEPPVNSNPVNSSATLTRSETNETNPDPPEDLFRDIMGGRNGSVHRSSSVGSNRSLEDTLREFGGAKTHQKKGKEVIRTDITTTNDDSEESRNRGFQDPLSGSGFLGFRSGMESEKPVDTRSESEDDDPGPDFFVSHS